MAPAKKKARKSAVRARAAPAASHGSAVAFVYPRGSGSRDKGAVVLDEVDRKRLEHGEYLNDNLIDLYLERATAIPAAAGAAKSVVLTSKWWPKVIESEFFGDGMVRLDGRRAYEAVKRPGWTRNVDIFDQDLVFVPLNRRGDPGHWSLFVVVNPGKRPPLSRSPALPIPRPPRFERDGRIALHVGADDDEGDGDGAAAKPDPCEPYILAMDSLRTEDPARISEYLREVLKCAWTDRKGDDLDGRFELETMPVFTPFLPKQENGFDCGVFVLKFFDLLFNAPLPERATDDDMTFGGRFSKELFGTVEVDAKRAELRQLFDAEWDHASPGRRVAWFNEKR